MHRLRFSHQPGELITLLQYLQQVLSRIRTPAVEETYLWLNKKNKNTRFNFKNEQTWRETQKGGRLGGVWGKRLSNGWVPSLASSESVSDLNRRLYKNDGWHVTSSSSCKRYAKTYECSHLVLFTSLGARVCTWVNCIEFPPGPLPANHELGSAANHSVSFCFYGIKYLKNDEKNALEHTLVW